MNDHKKCGKTVHVVAITQPWPSHAGCWVGWAICHQRCNCIFGAHGPGKMDVVQVWTAQILVQEWQLLEPDWVLLQLIFWTFGISLYWEQQDQLHLWKHQSPRSSKTQERLFYDSLALKISRTENKISTSPKIEKINMYFKKLKTHREERPMIV